MQNTVEITEAQYFDKIVDVPAKKTVEVPQSQSEDAVQHENADLVRRLAKKKVTHFQKQVSTTFCPAAKHTFGQQAACGSIGKLLRETVFVWNISRYQASTLKRSQRLRKIAQERRVAASTHLCTVPPSLLLHACVYRDRSLLLRVP